MDFVYSPKALRCKKTPLKYAHPTNTTKQPNKAAIKILITETILESFAMYSGFRKSFCFELLQTRSLNWPIAFLCLVTGVAVRFAFFHLAISPHLSRVSKYYTYLAL